MDIRGYEMHGDRMWSWAWIRRSLDLMQELGLNTLVFHRNELLDLLVLPDRWITASEAMRRWPIRYHSMLSKRLYLERVIAEAHARGIAFYLQTKEISFDDSLIEKAPQVRIDGVLCPTDPFWAEFLTTKVEEVLTVLPGLDGLIVSLATHESKVSIAANECECARCRATDPVDWYATHIGAIHAPLSADGKTLVVRDFSFGRDSRDAVVEGVGRVSSDIVLSLKNTPHDFFPTFPDNDRIGDSGGRRQWVEFDVWGEFFGLGVFPSTILDDLRRRIQNAVDRGVSGVVARAGGEVISDTGVLDTLNLVNLRGFAALAADPSADPDAILDEYLAGPLETAFADSGADAPFSLAEYPATKAAVRGALVSSWAVTAGSTYVLRNVFHEDCMFPDSVAHAFQVMTEVHSVQEWEPSAGLDNGDDGLLARILDEKDTASTLAIRDRDAVLTAVLSERPPAAVGRQLRETFDLRVWYVLGFRACAAVCFTAKRYLENPTPHNRTAGDDALQALISFTAALRDRLTGTDYPHVVRWMVDCRRLDALAEDARRSLLA